MVRDQPTFALSNLERAIVAHLQRNGRVPFRTLATELGVTETTIYRRTQQLMDAGYFQVIGVVDPLLSGRGHAVFAGINCDPMEAQRVATSLAAIPEMRFVALVTGTFDVVCELVTEDRAHLTRLLIEILPATQGLRTINTSWVLHTYMTNFLWDLPDEAPLGFPVPEDEQRGDPVEELPDDTEDPELPASPLAAANEIDPDSVDLEIVQLLQQNGRISYAEIASVLGLTESTARRRTLRLLTANYVRVVAISNPFLLGFQDVVLMWFKVDLSRLQAVARALSQQRPVRYLSRTAGGVDLVAEALFHGHAELFAFLNGPLAAIEGIRDVSVSFELTLFKRGYCRFDAPKE